MQRPFNRTFGCALWLLLTLAGCANAPEPAAPPPVPIGATTGTLGEAPYLIEVPASWNHELVMYLHGYEPKGAPREVPLAANDFDRWLLGKGYAVARSAFASQGWAVAEAMQDNERLREHALTLLGKPRRTWLIGHSLGGLLVLASLEQHPQAYDGGLSLCGVNTSADELIARGALDPLAVFDHYFPGVLGLAPAGLADPASPMFVDPAVIEAALVGNAERAAQIGARFEILRSDLSAALMLQYIVLRELSERAGGFPVGNRDSVYDGFGDDVALNAAIRRYDAVPHAQAYLREHASLSGRALKPVVIQANLDDPTVPAHFTRRYAEKAMAAGQDKQVLTLPPIGTGHCAFAPEDVDRAFTALVQHAESD